MAKHNELGLLGERLAARYLIGKGYKILAANWRFGKEEVDIITEKDGMLVAVEVKTRAGEEYGDPEDAVTRKKQRSIIKATNAYIEEHDLDLEVRFDVVGVLLEGKKHIINHIVDAFQPVA